MHASMFLGLLEPGMDWIHNIVDEWSMHNPPLKMLSSLNTYPFIQIKQTFQGRNLAQAQILWKIKDQFLFFYHYSLYFKYINKVNLKKD